MSNIGQFHALLGRNIDQLSFEDRQAVVQLLVEKVVVHPDGAVEVHHVLPFEEPPVAADQKKKGLPSEFYVLRLKQLHAPPQTIPGDNLAWRGPQIIAGKIRAATIRSVAQFRTHQLNLAPIA